MSQKSIILIVTLFALLVAGMFVYASLKQAELQQSPAIVYAQANELPEEVLYPRITDIYAKHFVGQGAHTLVGEVDMPTPCDLLQVETIVMESYPEQIVLDFTVINNADDCIQMISSQRFKVELQASSGASFSAKFMGRDVRLNLFPADEGQLPDEFELFIKG